MSTDIFVDVLTDGLIAWREQRTRQRQNVSINSFAEFLGYSRPAVNNWLLGKGVAGTDDLYRIAKALEPLLGNPVYERFGLTAPDPLLSYISSQWAELTKEQKEKIYNSVRRYFGETDD